ncbi:DUF305 domain-containing protein [Actinomadura rudentiformis]|uniref:DUF305 domain-containing protein n=1 Tax=Actinomadura rudentiformis TaxID=359158 RepID=A0A6H9YV67_9ACTN|nr:DUF305 domain-containing protein [Actinomadura rudentiformis]KAB2352451.1 DUF305 domain-containing protein [Actinomadura rudentiformis]
MKRTIPLIITPVLALALAACGGDDKESGGSKPGHSMSTSATPTTGQQAGQHNDQDVMFAQMMIPHHQQALEMAKPAKTKASMPEVKKLAADIEKAQGPEIKQMTEWLTSWGANVPSPGASMDHGGHGGAEGMMSAKDMAKLNKLSGMAYDKAFLEMMIKHHQGAVTMAKKEQSSGQFPAAKTMAGSIITSQTAEISTMRDLLKKM